MTERSRLVKLLRCLPCEIEDVQQPFPTEAHHLNFDGKAGQKRRGDEFQIPCCSWHHRALVPYRMSRDAMTHLYGPSLALDSRQFRASYGTDDHLLALTNHKLEQLLPVTA